MSEPINDGGPAFPETRWDDIRRQEWMGMSLRDYFAAQAITGILQNRFQEVAGLPKFSVAQDAYGIADAMLAARDLQSPKEKI